MISGAQLRGLCKMGALISPSRLRAAAPAIAGEPFGFFSSGRLVSATAAAAAASWVWFCFAAAASAVSLCGLGIALPEHIAFVG